MAVFAVQYRYADDSEARRAEHRPAHRAFLTGLTGEVSLLATGPWASGEPGALLILAGPDDAAVALALDADPFATIGVITDRTVREWTQVRGPWAD